MSGQHKERIKLHILPGSEGILTFDPECWAATLFLSLSVRQGIDIEISDCVNPDLSPSGQLPFLTHGSHSVSSLRSIIHYISGLAHHERYAKPEPLVVNLDAHLSQKQKAQRNACTAHVESTLGDLVAHMFYSLESNWYKLTKPSLAGDMPIPQRYYVPDRMRETWRERLQGHNLWHLPGEEPIENARFNLLETKFKKDERSVKEESRRIFNREKVLSRCRVCLDQYSRLIGDGQYIFNNRLSSLDVILTAHLLLFVRPTYPDELIKRLLLDEYPSLVEYAEQVFHAATLARQTVLKSKTTSQPILRTFVPQVVLQPKSEKEHRTFISEEPRFVQWRWAYFAVVAISMAFAWQTHGIRLVVVPTDEEIVGEKDIEAEAGSASASVPASSSS